MTVPQLTPGGEESFEDKLLGLREGKLAVMTETLGIAAPPKFDSSLGEVTESHEAEQKRTNRISRLRDEACKATSAALSKLEKGSHFENDTIDILALYFSGEALDIMSLDDPETMKKLSNIFRELMKEVGVLYNKDVNQRAEKEKTKAKAAAQAEPPERTPKRRKKC